jgi:hypothetical protein
MREQEFCWQEINLKLPMEELRTPTHILNAGLRKKKPSKSIKLDGKNIINTSYNVSLQKSWNVELWKLTSCHSWAQERGVSSSCLPTGACTPTLRITPEMTEEREFQRAKYFSRETFAKSAAGTERRHTCGGKDDGGTMVSDSCDSWLTRVRTDQ